MSVTRQKQIRLSEEGRFFLDTCKQGTGYTDTRVMELCLALQSLALRREVRRAHEFLYNNLVQSVASEVLAHPTWPDTRKMSPGKKVAAKTV